MVQVSSLFCPNHEHNIFYNDRYVYVGERSHQNMLVKGPPKCNVLKKGATMRAG